MIQHEMDHLNAVLILDRTTRDERKRALRELREAERCARAGAGGPSAVVHVPRRRPERQH